MSPEHEETIIKYTVILAVLGTILATGAGLYIRYSNPVCFLCY